MSETDRMRRGVLKAKEKLRINKLKILHFDSTGHMLVAKTKATVDAFSSAIGIIRSGHPQCLAASPHSVGRVLHYGSRIGMEHDLRIPS